jgi:hypothetical protein
VELAGAQSATFEAVPEAIVFMHLPKYSFLMVSLLYFSYFIHH